MYVHGSSDEDIFGVLAYDTIMKELASETNLDTCHFRGLVLKYKKHPSPIHRCGARAHCLVGLPLPVHVKWRVKKHIFIVSFIFITKIIVKLILSLVLADFYSFVKEPL